MFVYGAGMIGSHTDLADVHHVEILRRSVAMLAPDSRPFSRQDSLRLLEALAEALQAVERAEPF
jgi:hypothetical protein